MEILAVPVATIIVLIYLIGNYITFIQGHSVNDDIVKLVKISLLLIVSVICQWMCLSYRFVSSSDWLLVHPWLDLLFLSTQGLECFSSRWLAVTRHSWVSQAWELKWWNGFFMLLFYLPPSLVPSHCRSVSNSIISFHSDFVQPAAGGEWIASPVGSGGVPLPPSPTILCVCVQVNMFVLAWASHAYFIHLPEKIILPIFTTYTFIVTILGWIGVRNALTDKLLSAWLAFLFGWLTFFT